MKKSFIYILFLLFIVTTSCYKDIGNYDYVTPEKPVVEGVKDSLFRAVIGDSLRIFPVVKHTLANTEKLSYQWQINVPHEPWKLNYNEKNLKIVFGEKPGTYTALFIVTDHSNEMKYFFDFKIEARTEFTSGTAVLSVESGVTQLSFVKPDYTILPRLYEGINHEQLPGKPFQLLYINRQSLDFSYWVLGEGEKPGVIIDANTMQKGKYINDNFFDTPPSVKVGSLKVHPSAVTVGVINGKLYMGTNQTSPLSPVYGTYGNSSSGDYELSPYFIMTNDYFLGFNLKKKQFVRFNGAGAYFGTDYTVIPVGKGFDPTNVPLDLVYLTYINNSASYAYGKDATGKIYELKFSNSSEIFYTNYMRVFKANDLITADTKWEGSSREVIFFSSGDKVYRYNPVNEEIKVLDTQFSGKTISMLKLIADGDTLVVGTEGNLSYLDVSTGKNGNLLRTVSGIPGAPVDIAIRK
ncbi:PKD-like family lipoprotein [Cytophagaceae bacterium YF14B1]|uniref:PKD-like family lipoprotein n=1 Tax=Xanthocytophaga flava TaxID=3048013 RepID=A0AAE3QP99_9BACT|nr:PKD-like family lipoprotein [Xanthocytophaga flavus]MDJ1482977.1 PKD-like family lipoprotein [Xanthocytophaga flavus]